MCYSTLLPLVTIVPATRIAAASTTTGAAGVGSLTAFSRFNLPHILLQPFVVPLHILSGLSTTNCSCNIVPAVWCVLVIYCQRTLEKLVLTVGPGRTHYFFLPLVLFTQQEKSPKRDAGQAMAAACVCLDQRVRATVLFI